MLSSPSNNITNNSSYSNDRGSSFEAEYAVDPASGSFFHADFKKHDDLKEMLDSKKDSLKLEAMKRIIGMVAKGRDASVLFPAVVKNVVSKNIEVKKLVYVYLERYAEEQQDLALLSISTFQRALKEPNQLIRAGALRVLSSIRVKMISPIVMLAIKDASADMSPYVRKTAAHAIPKLNSLDPDMKPELITIIQKLLADKTVLVIGSAVMAFTEVCPERVDLIHQVFRKLCALLVDVDEWGQVTIVNMLTRYARSQFADPNLHETNDSNGEFYDSNSEASEKHVPSLDPDHRLLLRSTRPLLQSRNAAVVMSVAQLYHHASPRSESVLAAKSLVRFLRSHVEVQSIVLNAIASISIINKGMFEPYLKSFFVRTSDPTNVKLLKLEILTNITNVSNVSVILRELQTYISNSDKYFVAATIQAIGRCACSISEVTDSCLNGLVSLLSNRDEAVVAESVVVIKRLLQTQAADPKEIITHMARLLDSITVAQARAAILWLLGEHSQKVPQVAPDVLRKIAKTFPDEDDIVKLQVMNLAIKLYITNPEQTSLLCQYVCNLAKYDQNYDIRDKARFFKQFVPNQQGKIRSRAKRIFLAPKPAPVLKLQLTDHEELQLGSLSHYIKQRANGYEDLPPFPTNPPPGDVRNVEPMAGEEAKVHKSTDKKRKEDFAWESWEGSSGGNSSSAYGSSSSSSSQSESGSNEESSEEEGESSEGEEESSKKASGESSEESESASEESSSEENPPAKNPANVKPNAADTTNTNNTESVVNSKRSNLDLLLDLDDIDNPAPVMTPSMGGFFSPSTPAEAPSTIQVVQPVFVNTKPTELLNRINGKGLSATFRFTRSQHLYSPSMTNINLLFSNNTGEDIDDIRIGKKNLAFGMSMHDFACISKLPPNCSLPATLGIDFNDTTQPANFEIMSSLGKFNVSLKPNIGELLRPVSMNTTLFIQHQAKLRGMTEHSKPLTKCCSDIEVKVKEFTNLGPCDNSDPKCYRFGGQTLTSSSLVLVTVEVREVTNLTVNCENIVFGSVMLNELLTKLSV